MTVDAALLPLFTDKVTIAPFVSRDFNNVETFGVGVIRQAHVTAKIEEVLRKTGDVVHSTHRVVLTERVAVDERDRITLPARFKIVNPEIMAVLEWTDDNGPDHTTILVGPRSGASA